MGVIVRDPMTLIENMRRELDRMRAKLDFLAREVARLRAIIEGEEAKPPERAA